MPLFRTGITLFLMASSLFVCGQGAGFDSFISRISGQYKVDVAIAPELVPTLDSIKNVGAEITSIQELLYRLLNHSGITYQIIDGNKLMLRREDPADDHQMLAVLVGTVTDDQSGEPLPFATVIASNGNNACNTDERGQFILPVRDTTGNLIINYLGFNALTIPVARALHGSIQAKMTVTKFPLEEVIVVVPYRLIAQDYTTQSTDLKGYTFITEEELLSWNAERLITSLTTYTHYSSDRGIRIRGSEAGNSLIIMDDIPVYDPYHFYNIFSPFNGHYFSSVDVYKNNLPVEYGGRIDGMIHVQSKRERPASKLILDTDLLQSAITTEVVLTPAIYLTAGGRISHTAMLNDDLSDSTVTNFSLPGKFKDENEWSTYQQPTSDFYDLNLGLVVRPGESSTLNLHYFDSRDHLDNTTLSDFETSFMNHEPVTISQRFSSGDVWKNQGLSAGFQSALSSKTTLHLVTFRSVFDKSVNYTNEFQEERHGDLETRTASGFQESHLVTSGAKGYIQQQTGLHSALITGLEVDHHQVDFNAKEDNKPYLTQSQTELESSLFGEFNSVLWKKLNWAAGGRLTHLQSTGQVYALPNIRLLYAFDDKVSIRSAYSKNLQSVRALTVEDRYGRELDYLVLSQPEQGYPVLRSDKYMIGAGYNAPVLSLDAEVYYKKSEGLARVRPLNPDPSHGDHGGGSNDDFYQLFIGDGRAYGIDMTVLYKKNKVEASVMYTLGKIEERYDQLFNGDYFSPQEDRRHQVKASGAYTFGKFKASTLITYKSEAPYLSLVRLDGRGGIGNANYTAVQRYLPPYFSLDLGLEYSFALFKQPAMLGVSLINATNHQNISDLQHLGKVPRDGGGELYITSQTELLGRTANVHFRYLIN